MPANQPETAPPGTPLGHRPVSPARVPLIAGVAMGIGALCVVMLTLPLTSVLLAELLLASDGLAVMPPVIVAVVVAHVAAARIAPRPATQPTGSEHAGSSAPTDSATQA